VLLLAYGKKWLYAAGALFHVVSPCLLIPLWLVPTKGQLSAVWVFVDAAIFVHIVLYNTLSNEGPF